MKKHIILLAGAATLMVTALLQAQELCTEDFLFNAGFRDVDNLGIPIDWHTRTIDEKMHFEVENGALKIWVTEGGNFDDCSSGQASSQDLVLGQAPSNPNIVFQSLAGDTVYLRAWVKTTAIDEPTREELITHYFECRNGDSATVFDTASIEDPKTKTKFYNNEASNSGFQLVVQQAFHYSPNFTPKEWTPWYNHDGAAVEEWTPVTGKVALRNDVNRFHFWILLQSQSACTVWVDNIQVSSEPDFCGEPFENPGSVSAKLRHIVKRSEGLTIANNVIDLGQTKSYVVNVYRPNGRSCLKISGKGRTIDLRRFNLAAGAYVVGVKAEKENMVRPFVMPTKK